MKKKNGVNIMLFVFIIIFIGILSCSKNPKNQTEGLLLQTDKDFSAMSVNKGIHKAFLSYIADDGVVLRNNSYPLKGKKMLEQRFSVRGDSSYVYSWEPLFEKISESGEIGYTYGVNNNTNKLTGEITKGTYVTIWQKQGDGSWKFVLETGTQGLSEKPE
jgi:ketosteroid isomerase-like protein